MGSPTDEPCRERSPAKENLHAVTLTRGLEVAVTETTQGAFQTLMGYNPSYFASCGTNCPVDSVSWHEAAAYCNALSQRDGTATCYSCSGAGELTRCEVVPVFSGPSKRLLDCPGYRLPTEAEWEYAYRAGTTTALYNGQIQSCTGSDPNVEKIAWYDQNSAGAPHPVKQKQPNAWGLYDMAGNLSEWCHDWYTEKLTYSPVTDPIGPSEPDTGTGRVHRGGAFGIAAYCRAASRHLAPELHGANVIGFRCVRTLSP